MHFTFRERDRPKVDHRTIPHPSPRQFQKESEALTMRALTACQLVKRAVQWTIRLFAAIAIEGIVVAAILLGCSNQGAKGAQGRGPSGPPPVVIVSPATQRSIPVYGEFVGQTEAVNTVEIRSEVTGFLRRVAFIEGALVHTGDLLFVIDPRPYEAAVRQAKANLAQHEAALDIARQNVARYRPLVEKHAISQQQLDTAIAQAEQEAANVEAAQAQVAQAQLNLDYTKITAPLTGWIGAAQVKIGALVQQGNTLLDTLYSIDPIYVTFSVSEQSYLQYRQRTKTRPSAPPPVDLILADGSTYPYQGEINMVAPRVDPTTGTLAIRAQFPNPDSLLRAGLFVRVRLLVEEKENALVVPQQAVQEVQGVRSVLVVGNDNKVAMRTISTGGTVGNLQIINSGLKPGERVIVEGGQKVQPGMQVKAETAAPEVASSNTSGGASGAPPPQR